jgi:hypothetical protein
VTWYVTAVGVGCGVAFIALLIWHIIDREHHD